MKTIVMNRVPQWPHKVNFIDSNNVVLGYDMEVQCCERFGFFMWEDQRFNRDYKEIPTHHYYPPGQYEIEGKVFDREFYEETILKDEDDWNERQVVAIFRLCNEEDLKHWPNSGIFIHIYNLHNGYYKHGFNFQHAEEVICSGRL